jgi:hypothetical protein
VTRIIASIAKSLPEARYSAATVNYNFIDTFLMVGGQHRTPDGLLFVLPDNLLDTQLLDTQLFDTGVKTMLKTFLTQVLKQFPVAKTML